MNNETVFSAKELNKKLHEDVKNVGFISKTKFYQVDLSYISLAVLKMRVSFVNIIESQVLIE